MTRPLLVFIVGPTSSGKSAVALELAMSLPGEIISADSMQVYEGMSVITQAPDSGALSRVRHHLVGEVPPEEEFSAARFVEEAGRITRDILSREVVPVFAGGTGLYIRSLIDGIFPSPPKDEALREGLAALALEKGTKHLHDELKKVDPVAAGHIHPNDKKRLVRALEVYELTGRSLSENQKDTKGLSGEYDCLQFALSWPRETLYRRIEDTVERMFADRVVAEVEALIKRDLSMSASKALGIKEIGAYIKGEISVNEAKELLKMNTRRYAKRQLTWFRADSRVQWIDMVNAGPSGAAGIILEAVVERNGGKKR
ncbi:MAG: tRNA (adenosine(37)-N6)-dimethylallyltransferase MiaA [Candidatus Omnitrophica bacterium]|nr:tRNA (adenosine(37)-N6)-dimethylallyltransferase MiaA [Candidatus Omnitrophota bacterium]